MATDAEIADLTRALVALCEPMLQREGAMRPVKLALEKAIADLRRQCTTLGYPSS